MKILHIPNEILNQKLRPVKTIDKRIKKIVEDMILTLDRQKNPEGVGLAANQVGIDLSLFIMRPNKKSTVIVCINPEIVEMEKVAPVKRVNKDNEEEERLEGCLSVPRLWGHVERSPRVTLRYRTLLDEEKQEVFKDFKAIIVQHEMDHLNGILFTQRIVEQEQKLFQEQNGELVLLKMKAV